MRLYSVKLLILAGIAAIISCNSHRGNGIDTLEKAGEIFIQSLKESDFDSYAKLLPTRELVLYMIDEGTMSEGQKQEAKKEATEKFETVDYMTAARKDFQRVRNRYPEEFWSSVKIMEYNGLDTDKYKDFESTELSLRIDADYPLFEKELKLGEMIKIKGNWYVFTEPRWL